MYGSQDSCQSKGCNRVSSIQINYCKIFGEKGNQLRFPETPNRLTVDPPQNHQRFQCAWYKKRPNPASTSPAGPSEDPVSQLHLRTAKLNSPPVFRLALFIYIAYIYFCNQSASDLDWRKNGTYVLESLLINWTCFLQRPRKNCVMIIFYIPHKSRQIWINSDSNYNDTEQFL